MLMLFLSKKKNLGYFTLFPKTHITHNAYQFNIGLIISVLKYIVTFFPSFTLYFFFNSHYSYCLLMAISNSKMV